MRSPAAVGRGASSAGRSTPTARWRRSERLGCRVARYALSHCDAAPDLRAGEDGVLRGSIRDPRDRGYAWMLEFARRRGGWVLERFAYGYDDCDAIGVPEAPRGPIRLRDLRRAPD